MTARHLGTAAAVVVLGIASARMTATLFEDRTVLRPVDYMEYWGTGRAVLNGQNPYDGAVIDSLQKACGMNFVAPVMMWSPPWTLPLTMPVGAMYWRVGQLLWFVANLAAVLVSGVLLWRAFGGDQRLHWVPVAMALAFAPLTFTLLLGQITGLLVIGLAGFLIAFRANRCALAGACAALTAVKPHLFTLFALALALEAVRDRRTRTAVVVGGLLLVILGLIPLAWNPEVWRQYVEATRASSSASHWTLDQWRHPTLGYAIRMALPGQPFNAMFLPCVVLSLGFPAYWWARRRGWDWAVETPRLVSASLLVAPYGAWGHDLVVLLVPLTQAAVWAVEARLSAARLAALAAGYLAVNLLAFATLLWPESQTNPWLAPALVLMYALVGWLTRPYRRAVGSSPDSGPRGATPRGGLASTPESAAEATLHG